jgi:hypothetical protein
MRLAGLTGFIVAMWLMILAVAAFLITFVAPIDSMFFANVTSISNNRLFISIIQASIAIVIVATLVLGLNKMKEIYLQKKLHNI